LSEQESMSADGDIQIERRAYPRWVIDLELTFKVLKDNGGGVLKKLLARTVKAVTKNISGGGALLLTGEALKPGDRIEISLRLQSSETAINILAEVTRAGVEGDAVKFLHVATESDEVLQGMIRQKLRYTVRSNMTPQEALELARIEYFLRMLDEELSSRNL